MKIMLLAGLYLFFVRVLWSVFSELRDPRTVARKRAPEPAVADDIRETTMRGARPATYIPAPQRGGVATGLAVGQLVVVEPAQLAGASHGLGAEITVGRAMTNGIVLDDTYVSTVHARIFVTNGTYFVEDLSSRNGSTLNGQALVATTALVPGDRVQFGATTLEFS